MGDEDCLQARPLPPLKHSLRQNSLHYHCVESRIGISLANPFWVGDCGAARNLTAMIVQLLILQPRHCRALRLLLVGAELMPLNLMIWRSLRRHKMHLAIFN